MSKVIKYTERAFDLKAVKEENGIGTISGYGAVFGNVDHGGDVIAPGAFDRTLNSGKRVKMLAHHDRTQPIGVWVQLSTDSNGLKVTGEINLEVQAGKEMMSLIKQGALDGMSIGYFLEQSESNEDGTTTLKEINLKEISIVTFPMNEEATVLTAKSDTPELDVDQINKVTEFIRKMIDEPVKEQEVKQDELDETKVCAIIRELISKSEDDNIVKTIRDSINKK